jgi:REP element-mobilizing transposase RayT
MKPGTFTQMYVQLVFAVQNREAVLTQDIRIRIFEYMSGILTNMKHKSIIVNGISNHIHILIGLNPSVSVSDTVHDIKRSSSLFINNEKLCVGRFSWQEGYGGFSYGRSQIADIYNYIKNQESHHQKRTFQQEYTNYLNENEMEFNQQFLFDFLEDSV